jgi:gluconolactonase
MNGNLLDLHERLISCQAGSAGLKVSLTTNGVTVPLLTNYLTGKKFYSPNDLAMKSDGSIWFTDPGYDSGLPLPPPIGSSIPPGFQPGLYVYRFFENNPAATVLQVITNLSRPNGLCFSPDETKLYVADSANAPGPIRVFDVTPDNTLTGGAVLCTIGSGVPDGIKCDVDGRIWSSAEDGVEIFAPDGHLIGKIRLTRTANLCFGGPEYKTLYMVGQPYVSSIPVLVPGAVAIKRLKASLNGNEINIAWPAPSTGFTLQQSNSVGDSAFWNDVSDTPTTTNEWNAVTITTASSAKFFRLRLK